MNKKTKMIIYIFLKQFLITFIILSIFIIFSFIIYSEYMQKTERKKYNDKIKVVNQYTYYDDYGNIIYMTEFKYKNNILKSSGQYIYYYCSSKINKKVRASIMEIDYINNNKESEYQILKIYEDY